MRTAEEIFNFYDEGVNHLRSQGIFDQTIKNYNFFEGRQWEGLKVKGKNPPCENVIKQIVKHKYNNISMQNVEIVFTSKDNSAENVTKALNSFMEVFWEEEKMYSHMWACNKASHIAGDNYLYFSYLDSIHAEEIDNTNFFFENEADKNIQKQKYLIISQRVHIDDVKEMARKNGVSEEEIENIVTDEERELKPGEDIKFKKDKYVTVLLFLEKKKDGVHFTKCVRNVIIEEEKNTKLTLYPIANIVCNEKKGSARGIGEVAPLIDNQIEINKTLVRRSEAIKQTAFPKVAYNELKIQNPNDFTKAGSAIKVKGEVSNLNEVVKYLTPSYVSNDAKQYSDELIKMTKELNNSGDGAMGQVDPTKASGAAVEAVTQQANVSASEQMAAYKQFVEDIGYIFLDLWATYNPEGLPVANENGEEIIIPVSEIKKMKLKVNVTSATPFSKYSVESELKNLFVSGVITFEEYVKVLDENSLAPKSKFERIIQERGKEAQNEQIKQALINEIARLKVELDLIKKGQNDMPAQINMPDNNLNEGEIQNV